MYLNDNVLLSKYISLYGIIENTSNFDDLSEFLEFINERDKKLYRKLSEVDIRSTKDFLYTIGFDKNDDLLKDIIYFPEKINFWESYTTKGDIIIRTSPYFNFQHNIIYKIYNDSIYFADSINVREIYKNELNCSNISSRGLIDDITMIIWFNNGEYKIRNNNFSANTTDVILQNLRNKPIYTSTKDTILFTILKSLNIEDFECIDNSNNAHIGTIDGIKTNWHQQD